MIARDAAALDGRVGEVVVVTGRYEAFDQGRYRILGPDGPTPWLCQLELADVAP